nr:tRNA (adenosine(37)-N6)-threonylcarbamoyltransferase complex transferase subunit TsaD [bacterium]
MKILGIETSCDETAVCIIEATGGIEQPHFKVLGDALYSQVKTHAEYGGVFPMIAKREHAKNLVPLLKKALTEAQLLMSSKADEFVPLSPTARSPESLKFQSSSEAEGPRPVTNSSASSDNIATILNREPELLKSIQGLFSTIQKPDIDMIAVTAGPGLEPALWVGITFAQALSAAWNIPLIAANHMEGHIVSPLISEHPASQAQHPSLSKEGIKFPALALLISGGHTELVHINDWTDYKVIGRTRDDAIGEAFDKVARLLSLPYPGGPEISKLAAAGREKGITSQFHFPRPMINTKDYDFSFSGIKTSVLYTVQKLPEITDDIRTEIALEFENAVTEVIISKTRKALEEFGAQTLILGGGVIANTYIREQFKKLIGEFPHVQLLIPEFKLSTDNAVMIAAAAYI